MGSTREIRDKISSVKSTQKITSAMELVAASKMRRAQDRMAASKPYATEMRRVISHVAAAHSEFHHPYLEQREQVKRVGYIVVSTDRGLCGGLNVNLFRQLLAHMRDWDDKGVKHDLCLIGRKAEAFFTHFGGNVTASVAQIGDKPSVSDLLAPVKVMLDAFDDGKIDRLYLAYNEFVNTMTQRPLIIDLLPLKTDPGAEYLQHHWDYIYEPDDANILLTMLLKRYIESQVYQAVIENIACEQSARMVAMKSATDNAADIIKELQLIYNKVRQASITQEIAEICAGAAAVE
jgi:F-type H+-transporting ATPase subunit gamma